MSNSYIQVVKMAHSNRQTRGEAGHTILGTQPSNQGPKKRPRSDTYVPQICERIRNCLKKLVAPYEPKYCCLTDYKASISIVRRLVESKEDGRESMYQIIHCWDQIAVNPSLKFGSSNLRLSPHLDQTYYVDISRESCLSFSVKHNTDYPK